MIEILQALYFILPAYIANMAPVLLKWVPFGDFPLDHFKTWKGQRIFGTNKTYRGLVSGIVMGIFIFFLQSKFSGLTQNINLINYESLNSVKTLLPGIGFGGGAMLGDLIKSFLKRRFNIEESKAWFPFDQLDFVVGALVFVSFYYTPPLPHIIIIILLTPLLHFLTNVIGYLLKLKKVWW